MSVQISGFIFEFNEDEEEVLLEVALGIREGGIKYGPMDVLVPGRGKAWREEGDEEDRDWLVYRAASVVAERRRRKDRK